MFESITLGGRKTELGAQLVQRPYPGAPEGDADDLRRSVQGNLDYVPRSLHEDRFADVSAPRTTGALRAGKGVPLSVVMAAFRVLFSQIWHSLVLQARTQEHVSDQALVDAASDLWSAHDPFAEEMAAEHSKVLLETLAAWRDSGESASGAAAVLFCHPNTVRHRLRRIEAATGRPLSDPKGNRGDPVGARGRVAGNRAVTNASRGETNASRGETNASRRDLRPPAVVPHAVITGTRTAPDRSWAHRSANPGWACPRGYGGAP
ncbi:helix-turn-helix domain-containing protein [Amycolatopsis carbonis]|uniref:Helix-turn-helix domain-containing protein n=1 Tax=Amycolatopsis carbonis TaxID=715471 RepID=A0A9Y2IG36_9PSEU|nr:helix-turn-helix domain-containing protein [Amycolatopsis sp. 2-15]WIX79112.1 helix-turn-helix domain-containing protein [Amycolatopsis sp. 2-15]